MPAPIYGLKLPTSPQTAVFRVIERTLRADAALNRVVKTWQTWRGEPADDLRPAASSGCPLVRLTPMEGPDQFRGPSHFINALSVTIDVFVSSTNADDAFNLYWAIRKAIYPDADAERVAIHQALVTAGGRAMFTARFSQAQFQPVPTDDQKTAMLRGRGQLLIELDERLNP